MENNALNSLNLIIRRGDELSVTNQKLQKAVEDCAGRIVSAFNAAPGISRQLPSPSGGTGAKYYLSGGALELTYTAFPGDHRRFSLTRNCSLEAMELFSRDVAGYNMLTLWAEELKKVQDFNEGAITACNLS